MKTSFARFSFVRPALFTFVAAALVAISSSPAKAFTFAPSVAQYAPSGKDAVQTYSVNNNSSDPIAVKITAMGRKIGLNGEESMEPTNDFTIFPKQMTLKPNESRTIKVSYKGTGAVPVEKAYRIIAEQVPVDLSQRPAGSGVQFHLKYETSAYVTPPGAQSKITIANMKVDPKNSTLEFEVVNDGTAHLTAREWELVINFEGNKSETLKKQGNGPWPAFNVLPGSRRKLTLPVPKSVQKDPVSASINVLLQ